ncbi:hypothetical protein [Streptomyces sp. CBMA123]|uniref:hypothetical protein n=1 Tax=Streptomyces sp. CBMA123 TaxID=1896313 RepID=UPI001661B1C6|nr:hypothetical protein [Streptomyces sp. CBMA123]MBD0694612.1 hypothetical protein [Streptomyces sp. CBMA123]
MAAAVAGAAVLCGAVGVSAPAAFADGAPQATLSVEAPAAIGFAGRPVEFNETITNTGNQATTYGLSFDTASDLGTPRNAITIDYKNPADGTWKSIPLEYHAGQDNVTYSGLLAGPDGVTVPAGGEVTLDLRIGAPMGLPHDGASNGGFKSLKLHSSVVALDGSWVGLAQDTSTIQAESLTTSLSEVPATAVAGGDPIEFDAVLDNSTPSDYVNLSNLLYTDPHATVQVQDADGSWRVLDKVSDQIPDDPFGVYLQGRDSGIHAGDTTVIRVRVSYDATTPAGATQLSPCVIVNEGDMRFRGTTTCGAQHTVQILPATTTS